jgi:hypothetical protein
MLSLKRGENEFFSAPKYNLDGLGALRQSEIHVTFPNPSEVQAVLERLKSPSVAIC